MAERCKDCKMNPILMEREEFDLVGSRIGMERGPNQHKGYVCGRFKENTFCVMAYDFLDNQKIRKEDA